MGTLLKLVGVFAVAAVAAVIALRLFFSDNVNAADAIVDQAHELGLSAQWHRGGGRFLRVDVESGNEQGCDQLAAAVRAVNDAPSCIAVRCRVLHRSGDYLLLTSYGGGWREGSGSFPNCAQR